MSEFLHHLALGAADPEQLARFYGEFFGLPVLQQFEQDDGRMRSVWLSLKPGVLMIERTAAPAFRVEGIGRGPFLIAFSCSDLPGAEGRLKVAGLPIESRSKHSLYFRDPEGNRVALSCYPMPSQEL
jgi:catechol 2,3-dioxygenase-like lactoylglutathione lyase family enzyme